MNTVAKVFSIIFILIFVYLIVTSGGKFNTIVDRLALNIGRLTNQLQGVSANTQTP